MVNRVDGRWQTALGASPSVCASTARGNITKMRKTPRLILLFRLTLCLRESTVFKNEDQLRAFTRGVTLITFARNQCPPNPQPQPPAASRTGTSRSKVRGRQTVCNNELAGHSRKEKFLCDTSRKTPKSDCAFDNCTVGMVCLLFFSGIFSGRDPCLQRDERQTGEPRCMNHGRVQTDFLRRYE